MTATLDQCEYSQSGDESQDDGRFYGERCFCIPYADVLDLRPKFMPGPGNVWPGTSGWFAPVIHRYKLVRCFPGRPGFSQVFSYYRTPKFAPPDTSQRIRGMLSIDISAKMSKLVCPTSLTADQRKKGIWYEYVSGRKVDVAPDVAYKISAKAVADWDTTEVSGLVGLVNAGACFGGRCPAGTVMFMGGQAAGPLIQPQQGTFPWQFDSEVQGGVQWPSLWTVELYFVQPAEGLETYWRQYWKVAQQRQITDSDGVAIAGQLQTITVPAPVPGDVDFVTDGPETGDFSPFDDMLSVPGLDTWPWGTT